MRDRSAGTSRSPVAARSRRETTAPSFFRRDLVMGAIQSSIGKLHPRALSKNPVIFTVEIGAVICTALVVVRATDADSATTVAFPLWITAWLWFTVLFANFAEALAEARGKAQADSLRATRATTRARRLADGTIELVDSTELRNGDLVRVEAGDVIPGDGEVVEGVAFVNEAAITGESAPVLKEPGTDTHSSVTGGTTVVSDWLIIRIVADPGETFLDRMIALVEGASRQKTPNEIALSLLLTALTLVFLVVCVSLLPITTLIIPEAPADPVVLVALFVTLIPTTIGGLLSAIGIAGMDRVTRFNVMAKSGKAVEAAGDCDTLLLDKTGTITFGNRLASDFWPVAGVTEAKLAGAAARASYADETPEGRSIVALAAKLGIDGQPDSGDEFIPFSASTRLSGVRTPDGEIWKGAGSAVRKLAPQAPEELEVLAERVAGRGATPLAVVANGRALGVVELADTVKPGLSERFAQLRRLGIRTVMITGDNRVTASVIAETAGVDDFLAEATPEDKLALIRREQEGGRLVAMTGDGTNDAPALAQADVGMAMNSGTAAAKEAANMVDLDSDPTKVIEVVRIGKELLMTRGAVTTFSIANDVAKYFAIIPAMFAAALPSLDALNLMQLRTPHSAVVSAVIFNAVIIVALVPLSLRGVRTMARGATSILYRNLLIYGVGGLIVPFVGIKAIDLLISAFGWLA
ncbi:MAG TPA: potassium-transporting ATPase subunit KdpB [Acidimicrobiia bacterium]|nr:potassium-transporting ATPase subunit KdpB [Acidimicrobiia bacterium]